MSGFKILGADCPICQGARKKRDCRESLSTGLIHCHHSEASPGGQWHYIKDDAHGFGMWAWGVGESTERPLKVTSKPAKAPIAISIESRDVGYRTLIGRAGLSRAHRAEIAKRPYVTQSEIDALVARHHLFTWQGGEAVPSEARALPGVVEGRLKNKAYNWAIAIPDHTGQILGVQIKGITGGYQWASCDEARVHLPSGELPLGVYGTPRGGGVVEFDEGYFKPAIAAQRFGGVHIGMAGGNWANVPQQLRTALEALGCHQVVLNADGGAIANPLVMRAYTQLATRLDSWGIPLQVRWWGQATKADGDVDEITPEQYQTAQLLPWDEFAAMGTAAEILQRQQIAIDYTAITLNQEQERVELAQDSERITADVLALVDQQLVQLRKHELLANSYQTAPPLEQRDNTLDDVVIVNDQEAGYRQAIEAGAKLIVNVTSTGGNKTGFIAHSSPQNFGANKLISVTPDLLNAESFNPEFERWEMLQGGHHGVILKDGKRYRATVETPESEKIAPGNCGKATAIQIYASKNPANPQLPCMTCSIFHLCQKAEGTDYGRRYQAQQAWQKSRILTNYGRLRGIGMGEEIDNLANCVLHLDESSSNVETTKPLVVTEKNLTQTIAELSLEEPQLHQQLLPLLRWLKDRRYQEMLGYHSLHGITLAGIVDELRSQIPDDLDWAALSRFEDGHNELALFGVGKAKLSDPEKRRLKTLSTKREATKAKIKRIAELEAKESQQHEAHLFKRVKGAKGFRQLLGLDGLSKEERQELRGLKKQILTQEEVAELADLQTRYEASKSSNLSVGETALKAKEMRLRWLGEFVGIIQGEVPGHARIAHGEIVVTIQDNAHLNAIHAAKLTILTDASELRTKQALGDKYGIPADQIFIFEVGQPRHRNSQLIQITGLGKMGRQRGQGLEECKSALVAKLKELDPSHVHFDQKGFSHDARLFADSIGSNDYKNCTSLSATPPRPSINGLLDEFCTRQGVVVSKDDPVFQEFYNHRYAELIRQWQGRSRANLKPDVSHIHYIFTDDLLPITPDQVIPAYEICPEAARKGQRTIMALVEIAKGLLDQGQNLTQTALAIASKLQGLNNGQGYTQQYISKIFVTIQRQVQLFLKGSYKKSCRSPEELERLMEKASALGQVSQYLHGEPPATQAADLIQWMLDEIKLSDLPWILELVSETSRKAILGVLAAVFFPKLSDRIPRIGLEPLTQVDPISST